jgi:hypothetical protein
VLTLTFLIIVYYCDSFKFFEEEKKVENLKVVDLDLSTGRSLSSSDSSEGDTTHYPKDLFESNEIKNGLVVLYAVGKCFLILLFKALLTCFWAF